METEQELKQVKAMLDVVRKDTELKQSMQEREAKTREI